MPSTSQVEGWGKYQGLRGFSQRTIDRRAWSLSKLDAFLGDIPLNECSSPLLESWLSGYPNVQTRYTLRSDVHQFFKWAIRRDLAAHDPTIDVDPPRLPNRLPTPVPTADLRRLIEACTDDVLAMVMLASHAGLRVSEIAALDERDIQEGCIYVRSGKGSKDRSVPLSAEVDAVLPRRHRDLFPGVNGQEVSHRIRVKMRKVEIYQRPHDLRHSFGTELARRRVPIEVIAQLMGHSSLSTTRGYILLAAPERTLVEGMFRPNAA